MNKDTELTLNANLEQYKNDLADLKVQRKAETDQFPEAAPVAKRP